VSVTAVNPARLAELNHQRALVREQLAWIEREIARENATVASLNAPPPTTIASAALISVTPSEAPDTYSPDPVSAAAETRRGCFVALALTILVIVASLTGVYFWRYSDRSLFFPTPNSANDTANRK
jgi:hypothetical protein